MAKRVTVRLEDDLHGGPADETVQFAFEGVAYEIDLSRQNAAVFREQLAPYIEQARRAGGTQPRRPGRAAGSRQRGADIRQWARQRGLEVSERGRIPGSIREEYTRALDRPPGPDSTPLRPPRPKRSAE